MQCNNCKNVIEEHTKFCAYCGAKVLTNYEQNSQQTNLVQNTLQDDNYNLPISNQNNINNQTNIVQQNNNDNNKKVKKKKKHRLLKFLLLVLIIFVVFKIANSYKEGLNKIYLMSSEIYEKKDNSNFYKLDKKINKISLKIRTFKNVKKATIKLSSYNLILFDEEYTDKKKWKIEYVSLPIGTSNLEVKVTLENDQVIERNITFYNTSEENLGKLDTNDSDGDKLLNYQEEIYNTSKILGDSDGDGLTDYEEMTYTKTNPTKYSTYRDEISDSNDDYDGDGLSNIEEIKLGISAVLSDSDGDDLNDYDEIKNNTNPLVIDTDGDGVSDYDEVINFNTDPLTSTTVFSGKVESQNKDVSITLSNLSVNDIEKVKFEESGFLILNENMAGYIMPAYDISTTVPFTSSDITFNFENYKLEENAIPTIYYYNDETSSLEELPTRIEGKTAIATVNHFSTYILVDKNLYNNINQIDSNSYQIEITEKINGEYIFFVSPIASKFVNIPFQIITSPDVTEEQAEKIKEEIRLSLELDYQIEIKRIKSKTGFDLMKDFYNIVYDGLYKFMVGLELGDLFTTVNISDNSYYHNIADTLLIGYVQNTKDLSSFLTDGDEVNIFDDNYILIDLDDTTDTNGDGISDSHTAAILNGNIRTSTGINPFEGYTLEQIQKTSDLDKDGIKNGDEIKIAEKEGKLYIEMISNPSLKDSDFDGLDDKDDSKPLESNTPGFTVGGKLNDNIDTSYFEKEVNNYNRLFGTGEFDYKNGNIFSIKYHENGITKYSPNGGFNLIGEAGAIALGGIGLPLADTLFNTGDAKKALDRYYSKEANVYTEKDLVEPSLLENGEINSQSIFGSGDTQSYLKINLKKIMDISEETIKHRESKVIKTTKSLVGTSQSNEFEQNENVWGFLHSSSSQAIAEISNTNDNYTMKLRYFILDIYDWKNSEECDINYTFCKIEVDYFNDMLLGKAKAFLVKIEYDMEITWKKGGAPTIKLLKGTPYA